MDVSWLKTLVVGVAADIVTEFYEYSLERGLGGGGFFGVKTGRTAFVLLASLSVHAVFGTSLYIDTMVYILI